MYLFSHECSSIHRTVQSYTTTHLYVFVFVRTRALALVCIPSSQCSSFLSLSKYLYREQRLYYTSSPFSQHASPSSSSSSWSAFSIKKLKHGLASMLRKEGWWLWGGHVLPPVVHFLVPGCCRRRVVRRRVAAVAPRRAAPFVRPCQSVSHSIEDALHSDYYWIGFQWAYTYCLLAASTQIIP